MYRFSNRSKNNLRSVHPDLIAVAYLALEYSPYDFGITEGVRTQERQRQLIEQGVSWTSHSRHLTGDAIDFAIWINGTITWDFKYYEQVSQAFFEAAQHYDVDIVWGGSWPQRDGVHIERRRHG